MSERTEIGVCFERFSRYLLDEAEHEYGQEAALSALLDATVIQDYIEAEIPRLVSEAREGGASWQDVSNQLNVTRQAAWQRFSDPGSGGWNKGQKEPRVPCEVCGQAVARSHMGRHVAKNHPATV
jgi:hypothetical protein